MQVQCGSCLQLVETPPGLSGGGFACPRCGAMIGIDAASPPTAAAVASPAAAGRRCPYCGEAIQDDAVKCRHCGEWLDPAKRAALKSAEELRPKFQRGMKGLGAGVIVIAALNLFSIAKVSAQGGGPAEMAAVIAIVLAMAALGVLLLCRQVWANHAVIAVFGLLGVALLVRAVSGQVGGVIFVLIAIVAIVNAVGNIRKHSSLRGAGLDPWQKTERKG